jgi:hypothetical protein
MPFLRDIRTNEWWGIAAIVAFGLIAGVASISISSRRSRSLGIALTGAVGFCASVSLLFCFILGLDDWPRTQGLTVVTALRAAIGACLIYGVPVALVTSIEAFVFTLLANVCFFRLPYRRLK